MVAANFDWVIFVIVAALIFTKLYFDEKSPSVPDKDIDNEPDYDCSKKDKGEC